MCPKWTNTLSPSITAVGLAWLFFLWIFGAVDFTAALAKVEVDLFQLVLHLAGVVARHLHQQLQRAQRRLKPYAATPVILEMPGVRDDMLGVRALFRTGKDDRANRLLFRPATGSGDAGDRNGDLCAAVLKRATRHGKGDGLADRTVALRKALAIRPEDHRHMRKKRHPSIRTLEDRPEYVDLPRRIVDVIITTNHMCDFHI